MPTIAAVVVTYNRKMMLIQCLDALLSQSRPVERIVVIDNASTDGTGDLVKERYGNLVQHVLLPENVGGAGGFHNGMALAYQGGYDLIWVMDDDVRPEQDCLRELLSVSSSARVLAPIRVSETGEIVDMAHARVTRSGKRERSRYVCHLFPNPSNLPRLIELENVSFEGPLFHRSVISDAGLPRSDFFILCDDAEYSWRVTRLGLGPLQCVTAARMIRMLPASNAAVPEWRNYYFWRNSLHINRQYANSLHERVIGDVRFLLSYLKGALTGRAGNGPLKVRMHAWIDSFRDPMPRRYLPLVTTQQGKTESGSTN
jgi:GT2 family glycosyltransferase